VGGLTVVDEIRKQIPHESIVYAGDTARVPYGGKDANTLLQYGREIIRFLVNEHEVKAVVIACGTISSNVFDELREAFPGVLLIDVIRPGVRACAEHNPPKAGLIATEATVRSGLFAKLLKAEKPGIQLEARACPLFVPLVEEGWVNNAVTRMVAETYLGEWKSAGLGALVLGCTHYPLLSGALRDVLGSEINLINMAQYTVRALFDALKARNLLSGGEPSHRFFVSGYADKFDKMAEMILQGEYKAEKAVFAAAPTGSPQSPS
jgi:glutamate racemase